MSNQRTVSAASVFKVLGILLLIAISPLVIVLGMLAFYLWVGVVFGG